MSELYSSPGLLTYLSAGVRLWRKTIREIEQILMKKNHHPNINKGSGQLLIYRSRSLNLQTPG